MTAPVPHRLAAAALLACWGLLAQPIRLDAQDDQAPEPDADATSASLDSGPEPGADTDLDAALKAEPIPPVMTMKPHEIRSVQISGVTRIAIGNPDVLDVTLVSANELLIQAKASGSTNIILWDHEGQHASTVEVVDPAPEAAERQLRQLLVELNLQNVQVTRERDKLFLTGQVSRQEELDQLEQVLSAFPVQVTNLVAAPVGGGPLGAPGPLVKLAVQIIELNRSDLEKLGVKWSESVGVTQPLAENMTLHDAIFRWGTGLTRDKVAATLNALVQRKHARLLSEPTLVTASGKEASSFIGIEVPIITATSFGTATATVSATIEFRKTGVLLKMTPTVRQGPEPEQPKEQITILIEAEVSGIDKNSGLSVPVGSQTVLVPGFKVRKTNTEVTVVSGGTIIIAGLLEAEDNRNLDQVPAFGSMPIVGRLFRSPEVTSSERELVIAVTPELLPEGSAPPPATAAAPILMTAPEAAAPAPQLAPANAAELAEASTLRYALQIQQLIARSIRFPATEAARGFSGQVKLRLLVGRDGNLKQAVIAESSGIASFDAEAVSAAQRQAPYPAFPPDLAQQDLWLELPVAFRP